MRSQGQNETDGNGQASSEPELPRSHVIQGLERILGWVTGTLFGLMVTGIVVNVAGRYLFSSSLPWLNELVRFQFIWIAFLGAVLADIKSEHVALRYWVDRMSVPLRRVVDGIRCLVSGALFAMVLWGGWSLISAGTRRAPLLDIPMAWVLASVPVGAALLLGLTLIRSAALLRQTVGERTGR